MTENRVNTNFGVELGFLLQSGGLGLWSEIGFWAPVLIIISIPIFVWACMDYAGRKGYSKSVGLLGIAGIFGFVVLTALSDRNRDSIVHVDIQKLVRLAILLLGLILVVIGVWLDHLDSRGDAVQIQHPWPIASMLLGAILVIGSVLFVNKHR